MDSAQVSGSDSYPLPSPDPVVACAQYNLEEPSSPVGCWLLVVASEHSAIVERNWALLQPQSNAFWSLHPSNADGKSSASASTDLTRW
eukprot:CAMPEP_0169146500 /NCGR_PEP_ID=MMETSP1015-20121227/47621_1 /TAXON_ID=342587 /ORGANISM="Karlodinium micrum, Strain CCMP2283" /LENGTH=87 /DNA_ID=CAMNT_0009214447 /DNA_START=193 /DNA_END=456 /DNA_ORIENTATION=+